MADWSRFKRWLQDSVFAPLEDKKMPVMEHLIELQVRLTRAVIIIGVVFVGTFFYADTLVQWLRVPLQNMFIPGKLAWVPTDLPLILFVFLAPAEALWQNVKVAGQKDERRSEEHTSELQSRFDLVCRLLLEKKKKKKQI